MIGLNFQRYNEEPDTGVLASFLLQQMRSGMPRAGGQGFSDEALVDGEAGRLLESLLAPFLPLAEGVWRFGRQLTLSDARGPQLDLLTASYGLPEREAGEHDDDYVWRIMTEWANRGRTAPEIQANLAMLGFESEIYPMAGRLLVGSKAGRVPSTSRGLLPNARTKAGVYGIDVWGPHNGNAGVVRLLDKLTSAGYNYRLRFHIHWNALDAVPVMLDSGARLIRPFRRVLPLYRLSALNPSSSLGVPSKRGLLPSGRKTAYGVVKTKRKALLAPEAGILAYLPIPITVTNRYLAIDWAQSTASNLSYNLIDEPLRVDSQATALQAGAVVTKR